MDEWDCDEPDEGDGVDEERVIGEEVVDGDHDRFEIDLGGEGGVGGKREF